MDYTRLGILTNDGSNAASREDPHYEDTVLLCGSCDFDGFISFGNTKRNETLVGGKESMKCEG